jgi:hypothetical protein
MSSSSTDVKEIRKFGFFALIFFGCLAVLGFWRGKPIAAYFFGGLSLLGLCFLLLPRFMEPVHKAWLKMALRMNLAVTTLVLALTYYLAVTPCAWIKRITGGRFLPIKPDPKAASYWVPRSEAAQPATRFTKRY